MKKFINIGLIGYGYWGPNVAKNLNANPNIKMKWICDKDKSRIKKAKEVFVGETSYTNNYSDLLDDKDIDAIAIALGTSFHFKFAKEALLAGKNIYVEKPFTSSVEEAEILKELANKMNLKIHVNHIMVHHPVIKRIKELIESDVIGDILYIDAMRMNLGQIRQDVSAMSDLAVHDLTVIDHFTGGLEPSYVSALGERLYNPKESISFLSLRYPGFISHIQSSWISPLKERKLIVVGSKKMAVFDDMKLSEKLMIYDKGVNVISDGDAEYGEYEVRTREGDVWIPFIEYEDALYNSIESFRSSIVNNEDVVTCPDQAIRVQKILDKANKNIQ